MHLVIAALPGVITTCLLVWVLKTVLDRQAEERQAHRAEVDRIASTHSEQVDRLLQRIQAPEVAVSERVATHFPEDPPQIDLEDDLALIEQRERDLDRLAQELGG